MPATHEIPSFEQLLNPTLEALHALGGSASVDEISEQVITKLGLPDEIAAIPHGAGSNSEFSYRLGWARTYLKKVGLIDNSQRGIWSLTAEGQRTARIEPRDVVRRVIQMAKLQSGSRSRANGNELSQVPSDDDFPAWSQELLAVLSELKPDAFERLCMRVLRESGFIEVEVTGRSGDGGIDGRGVIRVAGLISFNVLFQCKRYQNAVGSSVVRDFRGAMIGRADKGLIITTATFTRDAKKEATRDGAPPIDLIDGELLVQKLKELGLGVTTKTVEVVEIDREWFAGI